uniref:Transcription initiation factor IIB n=1 Tax=Parastrongyloides trichosuri TaxID=131310 RepID=A0A0N4ZY91_PARTI
MDISCPNHPNEPLIEDHRAGDVICPKCGTVVGDRCVDVGTEWRSFSNEKSGNDPSRVGAAENPLLGGSDLSTTMAFSYNSSSYDDGLAAAQRRTASSGDKQMQQALKTIGNMCDKMHLEKRIKDRAAKNFKDVLDAKILKGKNPEAQAAACVYIACREYDCPRTFKEVCAACTASKKDIGKCFRNIMKVKDRPMIGSVRSSEYLDRYCNQLGLKGDVVKAARHIIKKADDLDLVAGRSPVSIAAAAIYMASIASSLPNQGRSATQISEVSGAADVTIRSTYKLLLPKAAELFPEGFVFETPVHRFPTS